MQTKLCGKKLQNFWKMMDGTQPEKAEAVHLIRQHAICEACWQNGIRKSNGAEHDPK